LASTDLPLVRSGESRSGAYLSRLLTIDFTRPRAAILLAVVFMAVRIPWLRSGYGAETDAYRVALSALHLGASGEYLPSRLPGYPVHELLMTPLVLLGGSVATNLATALAALAGVFVFAAIVNRVNARPRAVLVIALAFTPFLIVNSVQTKDYMWALTFILASYLAAIDRRNLLAGVLLGLGVGCRLTTGLFCLPLLLLYLDRRDLRGAVTFLAMLASVSFLVFLPVTLRYGHHFLAYADSRIAPDIIIRSIGQYSIGAIGALATLIALLLSWRGLISFPEMLRRDVHVRIWTLVVAVYVLLFLRLPIDLGYLIPIYPFGYLLLSRVVRPALFTAVVALIVVSGLVDLDISAMHNFNLRTFAETARPCRSCAELFHDLHARQLYVNYATDLARTTTPDHSVVLTGAIFPDFAVASWPRLHYEVFDRYLPSISMLSDDGSMRDSTHDVIYLASPDRPELIDALRQQGYQVLKSDPAGSDWHAVLSPSPNAPGGMSSSAKAGHLNARR
jgi:Glycosyltransferase family 87